MLDLLIITKDLNYSKSLLNYISENSCQIRVHSIANSLTEGIEILNTGSIDITLINLDNDTDFIINNLHKLSDYYFEKLKKSILIVSENIDATYSNYYIYDYIDSNEDISIIFLKICEIVKNKTKKTNNTILLSKINKELEYIGYNLSYYGSKYLAESIALIYNNYGNSENLNKNIYPIIAQKYNKTVNTVKGNIRTATTSMFYDCDETRLKSYFNFYTVSKPKPKLVIYTVLNKLYNML